MPLDLHMSSNQQQRTGPPPAAAAQLVSRQQHSQQQQPIPLNFERPSVHPPEAHRGGTNNPMLARLPKQSPEVLDSSRPSPVTAASVPTGGDQQHLPPAIEPAVAHQQSLPPHARFTTTESQHIQPRDYVSANLLLFIGLVLVLITSVDIFVLN
jgi:hypothetical protein